MDDEYCKVCQRLHEPDQPCPLRIANALMFMQPQALGELTKADLEWMTAHTDFNARNILEEAIANLC